MMHDVEEFSGRLAKIEGPARSGKTAALIARAVHAAAHTGATSVCVVAPGSLACQAIRTKIRAALEAEGAAEAYQKIRVATAYELCLEVLQTPAAQAFTGRSARVLSPDEYNFFLEDMKTLGQPVRRLRNMLGFFYAQWAALAPEESWLEPGEESNAREHMARLLTAQDALLTQEVAPLCYGYLKSDAGANARKQFSVMLCDDYQDLSRAEQNCVCLLAGDQLMVAGNAAQAADDAGANVAGFVDFEANREGVEVFSLQRTLRNAQAQAFVAAVLTNDDTLAGAAAERAGEGSLEVLKWTDPTSEVAGIAALVKHDIDAGVAEHEICLLTPNRTWAKTAADALANQGVKSTLATWTRKLGGDPRDAGRCAALTAYVKLALLADEHDVTAWRCWCGIGNYLTNSDAWGGLLAYAQEKQLGMLEALDAAAAEVAAGSEPFLRAGVLAQRREEGLRFIAGSQGRRGFALLKAVGADTLGAFEAARELICGDEDAAQICSLVRRTLDAPTFDEDPHRVRIIGYGDAAGLEFSRIYAIGTIDGFMPTGDAFEVVTTDEKRSRALRNQRRVFCNAVAKANDALTLSYFSKAPLELAERTKMHVLRVRADAGGRVALVRPSVFIGEAGAACPGADGGQAKLASFDLA